MDIDRRRFASSALAAIAFAGFANSGLAQGTDNYRSEVRGYGPLLRDRKGLLDLPSGFRYDVISSFGEVMDDAYFVPDHFDGMACFAIDRDRVALVRNHELEPDEQDIGPSRGKLALIKRLSDEPHFGKDMQGKVLPGGASTLIYNLRSRRRERQFLSLAGTDNNCAGGATPWGSWLSCEESVLDEKEVAQSHGWVFEVPASSTKKLPVNPLKAMGRFRHEAVAVDPGSGIAYLTEDRDDGLFYRFLPNDRRNFDSGGRLQALVISGYPGADTTNWSQAFWTQGAKLRTSWIDLEEVESPRDDLRLQGRTKGAAIFARGEGVHFGNGELFFTCTSGGVAKLGQIARYVPSSMEGQTAETESPGILELFVESRDPALFDYGDNLTVMPTGHLMICEDRADGEPNHLRGITPSGAIYTFARLHIDTELAGVCFSPDGGTMFVNIYSPGRTLAISGPWSRV